MNRLTLSLYANGSLSNHGCEALYRSFCKLLHIDQVFTQEESDRHAIIWNDIYGDPLTIHQSRFKRFSFAWFKFRWLVLWHNMDYAYYAVFYRHFRNQIVPGKIYASIGGDNYCYHNSYKFYIFDKIIRKKKGRTVFLGCSITPDDIDKTMLRDLSGFELIIARESITYKALMGKGLKNVELLPDPAFILDSEPCELPPSFIPGMTVGINVSPEVLNHEQNKGIVIRGIQKLIDYILHHTPMNIALVPHVVQANSDDFTVLNVLYNQYSATGRISLIPDMDCCRLKYIIGQCRFLVAARTHASIAAYSQSVPTLVIGYSVKAKGIARDLFGTADHYVCDVRDMSEDSAVTRHFQWLMDHEKSIREHYRQCLAHYIKPLTNMEQIISEHLFPTHG